MIFPPSLQERIASLPAIWNDEQRLLEYRRDMSNFLREELRVHGRLRNDAYPDLCQMGEKERLRFYELYLRKRPFRRFLVKSYETVHKAARRLRVLASSYYVREGCER